MFTRHFQTRSYIDINGKPLTNSKAYLLGFFFCITATFSLDQSSLKYFFFNSRIIVKSLLCTILIETLITYKNNTFILRQPSHIIIFEKKIYFSLIFSRSIVSDNSKSKFFFIRYTPRITNSIANPN